MFRQRYNRLIGAALAETWPVDRDVVKAFRHLQKIVGPAAGVARRAVNEHDQTAIGLAGLQIAERVAGGQLQRFARQLVDRGLVGHLLNGYDTSHLKKDLRGRPIGPDEAAAAPMGNY